MTTFDRWVRLMGEWNLGDERDAFEHLLEAWNEPHRHYHSVTHLAACLRALDSERSLAEHPAEVELGLWFHDAIYSARRSDDEARSAAWSRRFVLRAGGEQSAADRVHDLVLATRHDAAPAGPDAALLVDVDLSILGADTRDYEAFEAGVRAEYRWVPGPIFRRRRRAILRGFLDRPRIYSTEPFHARLDATARSNLARAVRALGG